MLVALRHFALAVKAKPFAYHLFNLAFFSHLFMSSAHSMITLIILFSAIIILVLALTLTSKSRRRRRSDDWLSPVWGLEGLLCVCLDKTAANDNNPTGISNCLSFFSFWKVFCFV